MRGDFRCFFREVWTQDAACVDEADQGDVSGIGNLVRGQNVREGISSVAKTSAKRVLTLCCDLPSTEK